MSIVLGSGHSDVPPQIVRKSANYHPSVWGNHFVTFSSDNLKADEQTVQRANKLKEEVKKMLGNVSDSVEEINMIDMIQRLGVAYHFEKEIEGSLLRIYNSYNDCNFKEDGLHATALRFRLLRQQGYNVSPDVFIKFKDDKGDFNKTLTSDIHGLISLYEAAHLGTHGEEILDEAIEFCKEHLQLAFPNLKSPLSTLVELALELPLRRRVERLYARYYIPIYENEKEKNHILLEFSKLDFNLLQLLHQRELRDISKWWKDQDFSAKLPFIRDRVVECYFWITGVYFEPKYSLARMILTRVISLTSIMDDIYDVYGTLEELEPYTEAIQRWERSAADKLPEYMKLHFYALLDTADEFEEKLARDGKSYGIPYLKESFKELSRYYFKEAEWCESGYVPKTLEEYMRVAMITCGHVMLTVASFVGMGDIATKEAFEWAKTMPPLVEHCSIINRARDDITSNELEQERGHVASCIQVYMKEHGKSYEEACEKLRGMAVDAWKSINKELLRPTVLPVSLLIRPVNFARVIELLYQNKDEYTDSKHETKERITMLLVDPIPI